MIKKIVILACTSLFSVLPFIQITQASDYTNSIGMEFIQIEAGCFNMGRNSKLRIGGDDELPRHKVCIKKPFLLGKTEVTQKQWVEVMKRNPSRFKGDNKPVERVSWKDVQIFIKHLDKNEGGKHYRLPTEAEWEYAARAGSDSIYHFGDDIKTLTEYAWFSANSDKHTHPVAQKKPNQWGLYDMHGNVHEWVQDLYGSDYYRKSTTDDPPGADSGWMRVYRGGSWFYHAGGLRSTDRNGGWSGVRYNALGFRLLRTP
jgi:formylglycine-generating enzyme required for sulfatase activity